MALRETPIGLALTLCDAVIEDKYTGKKTLVGLFDRVHVTRVPAVHPFMCAFVSITGGVGEYACEIACGHTDGGGVAFASKGTVKLDDPLRVVDMVFRLKGVRFAEAGSYTVRFIVDEVPIMMRPLTVVCPATPRADSPGPVEPQE